jgi:hypothetical protein
MTGGPVKVDPAKIPLSKLQAAVLALGIAAGSAVTALEVVPPLAPSGSCVMAEEVYYAIERDTLYWVPTHGSATRDSLVKLEGLPDTQAPYIPPAVQVCFTGSKPPSRPVWKAGGAGRFSQ